MGRPCSMHGEMTKAYRILHEKPEGRRPWGRLRYRGWLILMQRLKKHGNESCGWIKGIECQEQLSNYQPLKVLLPWSQLVSSHYIILYFSWLLSRAEGIYISQSFIKIVSEIRHLLSCCKSITYYKLYLNSFNHQKRPHWLLFT
jgi:hypothetical protein